jgi:SpoVK/Ycf46/Vps4 family AAA+-type ATPase
MEVSELSNFDKDMADDFYKEGNLHYEKGDFEKAIDFYTKGIECSPVDNPNLYKSYYNRGLAHACQEEYVKALADVQKVVELMPNFPDAYYILGLCCEYLDQLDIAIWQYKRALEKKPDFTDAMNRMELCYSKKKKQSEHQPQPSKPSQQDHSETLTNVRKLKEKGSLDEALILLEKTLKKDPDNFKLLLQRRILIDEIRGNKCEVVFGLEEFEDAFDRLVICPLKYAGDILYQAPIAQSSKGLILYGPPGCGKNIFVRVMAKQAKIKLIEVVLSEVLNMWAGESEKRIAQIFHEAIEVATSGQAVMIFIDEVDALGFARSMTPGPEEASWSRHLIDTFLRLFNEIEDIPNLVVVGATNSFWSVDDALKRPGRLGDSIMYIPPPDEKTRESMFKYFSKDTPGHQKINYGRLAAITPFLSGADIKSICKDVHLEIAREIVKYGRTRTKAKNEHYEWYIDKKNPTVLSWTRKVEKALAEEKIQNSELDPQLLNDIKLAHSLDRESTRTKRRK